MRAHQWSQTDSSTSSEVWWKLLKEGYAYACELTIFYALLFFKKINS